MWSEKKFKCEWQIMQIYAKLEWIWCATSPPMMLSGTGTIRRKYWHLEHLRCYERALILAGHCFLSEPECEK